LGTAHLNSDVYNIGDNQLLISVTKGWLFNDVMKFALSRPEVEKVYYNGKDYFKDYFDDDADRDL
jgi:hypothetical protein